MNKKLFLCFLHFAILSLFCTCLSTQKYASFINQKNQNNLPNKIISSPYFVLDTANFNTLDSTINVKKIKNLFIPALFYWEWEISIKCELNMKSSMIRFYNYLLNYVDSVALKSNLNGKKVLLTFENIPRTFIYSHKGFVVFVFVAYATNDIQIIVPEKEKLVLSYKILDDSTELVSGKLELNCLDIPLENIWKSTKKFTWLYLDSYEENMKKLSKNAYNLLEKELKN